MGIKDDIKKEFKKDPVVFICIAIALPVLLTLTTYTEGKPVIDTKPVVIANCESKPITGECKLEMAVVE
jgi:hypothetical protein